MACRVRLMGELGATETVQPNRLALVVSSFLRRFRAGRRAGSFSCLLAEIPLFCSCSRRGSVRVAFPTSRAGRVTLVRASNGPGEKFTRMEFR